MSFVSELREYKGIEQIEHFLTKSRYLATFFNYMG